MPEKMVNSVLNRNWKRVEYQMKKKPKLSQFERDRIEAMFNAGHEQKEIAKVLQRDKGTISREIQRNRRKTRKEGKTIEGRYESSVAQHKACVRRKYAKYQGKKINECKELKKYVVSGLEQCWNPDEISGRMIETRQLFYASKTAIYEWLYSVWGQPYCHLLPSRQYGKKKQRKAKKTAKEMIPFRIGIEARPAGFELEFGHFEHDTFVSGRKTGNKTAVSVLHEPIARYVSMRKIDCMRPKINEEAVQNMLCQFKKPLSLTRDNGMENKCHLNTSVPSFFCDPYSAWQKPHIENVIKLLRRFFRKGSDLSQYASKEIALVEKILNNKPRKCLGYKKPIEIMLEHDMLKEENRNRWEVELADITYRPMVAIRG